MERDEALERRLRGNVSDKATTPAGVGVAEQAVVVAPSMSSLGVGMLPEGCFQEQREEHKEEGHRTLPACTRLALRQLMGYEEPTAVQVRIAVRALLFK